MKASNQKSRYQRCVEHLLHLLRGSQNLGNNATLLYARNKIGNINNAWAVLLYTHFLGFDGDLQCEELSVQ